MHRKKSTCAGPGSRSGAKRNRNTAMNPKSVALLCTVSMVSLHAAAILPTDTLKGRPDLSVGEAVVTGLDDECRLEVDYGGERDVLDSGEVRLLLR